MAADGKVEILAAQVRAANILGRSEPLRRLFDFLVARSGDATVPKEAEVAADIMLARPDFDASQDASVRVYVHRLRQKLDEYYAATGQAERLAIPKGGGYRLVVESQVSQNPSALDELPPDRPRRRWGMAAAVLALLLLNGLAWIYFSASKPAGADGYTAVRAHAAWSGLLKDNRPITLVVGDYYIFGEVLNTAGDNRLVREYSINSPADLDTYLMQHPSLAGRYVDLNLFYLPTSIAAALKSITPILSPTAATSQRIHVIQASALTPDMIKHTDIVYVGYLSGLGLLRDAVFSGSRFSVGATYDELIDNVSRQHYESQEGGPDPANEKLRDFGYFSTFPGPDGNTITVIAGTRDIAVVQMAEAVTSADSLAALAKGAGKATAYEALYEVAGINRINLGGHLLLVSPLHTDRIWNAQPSGPHFPNG